MAAAIAATVAAVAAAIAAYFAMKAARACGQCINSSDLDDWSKAAADNAYNTLEGYLSTYESSPPSQPAAA